MKNHCAYSSQVEEKDSERKPTSPQYLCHIFNTLRTHTTRTTTRYAAVAAIITDHRSTWVMCTSVVRLTAFFHENCSEIVMRAGACATYVRDGTHPVLVWNKSQVNWVMQLYPFRVLSKEQTAYCTLLSGGCCLEFIRNTHKSEQTKTRAHIPKPSSFDWAVNTHKGNIPTHIW